MNVRHACLLASLVCAVPALFAAPGDAPLPETVHPRLGAILRQAVEQSPRMIQRAIDLEMAENNRISARSALLPFVGGNFSQYESRDDRADLAEPTDVSKTYYNLSVTQPLWYWGERKNTARIGEIQKQIAEGNYQVAYRGLVQEVRAKYMGLIVQKVVLARTRHYVAHLQQQARLAEDRRNKQEISEVEYYPVQLAAEYGQINLERTEFDFAQAKHIFARLAGLPAIQDTDIPDEIPAVAYQNQTYSGMLGSYLAATELPSIEAVNMRHQMRIEELNYKNQRTRLLPKLSAVIGNSQDEQSYTLNTAQKFKVNSLYGGVSVNWTIFDGFAAQAGRRNALARMRQIKGEYEDLVDRLSQQAQTQAKQLDFSARGMAISDRALKSGETAVKSKQDDFKRGVASDTDVRLAEVAYFDARINAYNARMDFLLKNSEFLGTLNEDPALANLPPRG